MPLSLDILAAWSASLGSPLVIFIVVSACAGLLYHWGEMRQLTALTLTTLLTVGVDVTLKLIFQRPPPHLWTPLLPPTAYSFPSGHSMVAIVVYGTLAYLCGCRWPQRTWSFTILAALIIFAVGLGVLLAGVHWPSDVLGGYAAGAVMLCGMVYCYEGYYGGLLLLFQSQRAG